MTPLYKNERKDLESFDYKIVESLVRRAIRMSRIINPIRNIWLAALICTKFQYCTSKT